MQLAIFSHQLYGREDHKAEEDQARYGQKGRARVKVAQILPAIKAAIMQVIKCDAHGIVPDRHNIDDADMPAAGDDLLF